MTEITNATASSYGGAHSEALPEDAVVGYLLEAQYSNHDRLGKTVTYYAFEYSKFYDTFITARQDIVQMAMNDDSADGNAYTVIRPITIDISKDSDTVPGLVLLFGGDECKKINSTAKYEVWSTGGAVNAQNGLVGMGRGYRYLFAYTATYSISQDGTTAPNSYPYDHGDYHTYRDRYGAGYVSDRVTALGAKLAGSSTPGVAYILNSGMQSAPRIAPEFHSYVYDTPTHTWPTPTTYSGTGVVTVHYTWRDLDGVLTNTTKVTGFGTEQNGNQLLMQNPLENDTSGSVTPWYEMSIPYSATASAEDNVQSPQVEYSRYDSAFAVKYNTILASLYLSEEADSVAYLCTVAYELPYVDRYRLSAYSQKVWLQKTDNLANNYISFRLTDENNGGGDAIGLSQRAYAMKLTFTADDVDELVVWLPVTGSASTGYSATLATSTLSAFVGKTYTVSASLYYDNGLQGWKILEDGSMFALQYINTASEQSAGFGMSGGYVVSNGSGSNGSTPQAAVVTQYNSSVTASTLRGLISADAVHGRTSDSTTNLAMRGLTGWALTRAVYPDALGVLSGDASSTVKNLGERYVTPKGVSEYPLKFYQSTGELSDNQTDTLSYITPSITMRDSDREQSQESIAVNNFIVEGASAGDKVYALLYSTDNLSNASNLLTTGRMSSTAVEFALEDDGNGNLVPDAPKTFSQAAGTTAPLAQNTNYYMVFYMKLNGSDTVLMKKGSSDLAVYTVKTSSFVTFERRTGPTVTNASYFNKTLTLDFFMDRVLNVSVTADILDEDGGIILSYNDMNTAEDPESPTWKMISITNPLQKKNDRDSNIYNTVTIDLKPSALRNVIVPGKTYKLRLTAWENGANVTDPYCTREFDWKVPAVTNIGAVIYVTDVQSDSITYEVSVSDSQYSLMGNESYASGAGLYAVRFTDSAGNWIPTTYDGQIYTVAPKQTFTLSSTTIVGDGNNNSYIGVGNTTPGDRMYRLNVYAVADIKHVGLSKPTNADDTTGKSWKYFFEGADAAAIGGKFQTGLLNTFWKTDTLYNNPDSGEVDAHYGYDADNGMSTYESNFRIAEKLQQLADQSNIYVVNEDYYVITRSNSSFTLTLPGSYGLDQAIKKVEWQVEGMTSSASRSDTETNADGGLFTSYGSGDNRGCRYTFSVSNLPPDIAYNVVIKIYTATDTDVAHSSYSGARIS